MQDPFHLEIKVDINLKLELHLLFQEKLQVDRFKDFNNQCLITARILKMYEDCQGFQDRD